MNVEHIETGELTRKLTIEIGPEDYAEALRKRLNARKREAEFRGFRKGMAPLALVKRVYGDQCLVDSVNDIISGQLDKYVKDNNLRLLGEPLSSEDQPQLDWQDGNSFTFKFDLGLRPQLSFEVGKEDKVPYYDINITKEAVSEMKKNILRQFGSLEEGKKAGKDDYVICDFSNAAGHKVEGVYVTVRNAEGEAHDKFLGAKVDDKFQINVNEAFTNETDRAAMLKVKKDELAGLDPIFDVTIVNIKTFVPAEANQDTFDKAFGKDKVHNDEEFEKAVEEQLARNYTEEADYRFSSDLRKFLIEKSAVKLPEDFLRKWLHEIDTKTDKETLEREFPSFMYDFKWQLVRDYLMEKFSLKVEDKDLQEAAEAYVTYQYAQYGMGGVPEEYIKNAANDIMRNEDQVRNLLSQVESQKVIAASRDAVTLNHKKISVEKFRALE